MSANKKKKAAAAQSSDKSYRWFLGFAIAVIGLVFTYLAFRGSGPTLYESDATVTGDIVKTKITNKGRAAQLGDAWCAAGAFLNPGTAKITKVMDTKPDFFRFSMIAPDQQEILEMNVPPSINPKVVAQLKNPILANVSPSTNWVMVCRIPYWDKLDRWKWFEEDLEFCYEIQPTGMGVGRWASMCPAEELRKAIHDLK